MLVVEDLVKTFPDGRRGKGGRVIAVGGMSFEVPEGKLFTLLGPSGCGKTTTLRCIAGLETPDAGEISVGDRVFFSSTNGRKLRANERGLGMVFQSYAIWPHMNVFDNAAFPLVVEPRNRRRSRREIRAQVDRVLATVKLEHLANRRATDLSGGQQQRLALARALVTAPPLLLLDEPLSNLDAKLREEMRLELKRLQRELGITAVLVTHDQVEALAISNLVGVMKDGVIKQIGRPREIYERPASRFVADFIGRSNFIEGVVGGKEGGGVYVVSTPEGAIRVASSTEFPPGVPVVVAIRPEHVQLQDRSPGPGGDNRLAGQIVTRGFLGEFVDHVVATANVEIRVRCSPKLSRPPGAAVSLVFPQEACSLLPIED